MCTSSESLENAHSDGVTISWVFLSLRPVLTACFDCPRIGPSKTLTTSRKITQA